jgi:ankyrin repeat protein
VGVVGLLLSRSTSLLKVSDKSGQTCLHVAASSGHYEMVQVLLGQGSDYNSIRIIMGVFALLMRKVMNNEEF